MNLYIGNLPYRVTEEQLRQAFEQYGAVTSCTIIKDKMTGQSKGFGFLEMPESAEAEAAITGWNGRPWRLPAGCQHVRRKRPRKSLPVWPLEGAYTGILVFGAPRDMDRLAGSYRGLREGCKDLLFPAPVA